MRWPRPSWVGVLGPLEPVIAGVAAESRGNAGRQRSGMRSKCGRAVLPPEALGRLLLPPDSAAPWACPNWGPDVFGRQWLSPLQAALNPQRFRSVPRANCIHPIPRLPTDQPVTAPAQPESPRSQPLDSPSPAGATTLRVTHPGTASPSCVDPRHQETSYFLLEPSIGTGSLEQLPVLIPKGECAKNKGILVAELWSLCDLRPSFRLIRDPAPGMIVFLKVICRFPACRGLGV